MPDLRRAKGAEFSPNGRFLYVADHLEPDGGQYARYLYQYDLAAPDVLLSRVLLASNIPPFVNYVSSANVLALAPDGRIHVAQEVYDQYLGVIDEPDLPSPACSYVHDGFAIPWTWLDLPAPIKDYHDDPGFSADVLRIAAPANLVVHPNPAVDRINLSGSPPGSMRMRIRDATGRAVGTHPWPQANLDVSGLPSGLYSLELQDMNGARLAVARFVKE
ncbi:MAG: T9SS type A sorting domain-containing protein [Flavobacteriales bacterium]|nr:T9SS type A sorting domain-containing protein [Flavobacteriales bacterium]